MKTNQLIRMMAVVLVALLAGTSPTWAWGYEDWNFDEGGGRYYFRSENHYYNDWNAGAVDAFRTQSTFSFADDRFAWEFEFRVLNPNIYIYNVALEGEVFVVTRDDVSHKMGTWKKTQSETSNPTWSVTDSNYGTFNISKVGDGHSMKVKYSPKQRAFDDGVKCIVFKSHILYNYQNQKKWDSGWMQYEKPLDLSSVLGAETPMPRMTYEWKDDGDIVCTAKNMLNKFNNSYYSCQRYGLYRYCGDRRGDYDNLNPYNDMERCVITDHYNGTMDAVFTTWVSNDNTPPYTTPVFTKYFARTHVYPNGNNSVEEEFTQPYVYDVLKPFTYPATMSVEFDKWNKHTTIKWTRQNTVSANDWNGQPQDVACRFDGKWYVVRYEKDHPADYTLLGSKKGDDANLQMTDDDFEYEKDYVYRVLFIPTLLENKCKDHLTEAIPGENPDYTGSARLWKETALSTKLDMPIRLAQDRTYLTAVHLVWEYCVQPSGQNWTIEYSPAGENAWRVLDNSLNVDPDKSVASFDADGTVCDLMDYRVKTAYAGKEFYSNVITGSLPAGSYISEVKASTGTEEKTVVVKWKVTRADMTNDIYYRVLRRQIGTEEWTLVTDDIHGTASEYTYTDDRVMAGSYYEYTVEAYGAKCEDQLVKTDEVITPGFSQARGTITGHIAFGTGTAVSGVRVKLVKSSADEDTDQPQFLSRYIEGEGKGLQWMADSAKYASVLNSGKNLTLQLWAKPDANGAVQMGLLNLPGTVEIGVKRIGDTSGYELQLPVEGDDRYLTVDGSFMIGSASDWKHFADLVNGGRNNLNAVMTADVNLSEALTMVGTSSHPYSGTFDGNGHTLTFNPVAYSQQYVAPFHCVGNATIRNLHVAGSISSSQKFAAGLIASLTENATTVIENCRSSVNVGSTVSGDATNGGFVANAGYCKQLTLRNCLFDGSLTGENSHSFGGFVGWSEEKVTVENSVFAPSSVTVKSDACCTFARMRNASKLTLTKAYYTQSIGTEQGTSMSGHDLQTLASTLGASWSVLSDKLMPVLTTVAVQAATRKAYTVATVEKGNGTSQDSTAVYQLYAVDLTTATPKVKEFPSLTFSSSEFTHVAAIYNGSSKWTFYVGTDTLRTDEMTIDGSTWSTMQKVYDTSTATNTTPTMGFGGSNRVSGNAFKGYVDDIRLWRQALSEKELNANYTRILGGTEDGLMLYWPLDEGISVKRYAFDVARQDGIYQLNHPVVGVNATPSATVPNARYLALYGLTDAEGDYIIKGIPFQQGGTNYKLVPSMGSHEFNPNSRSMFISPTSLTANNIDFEDVSSFPMSGHIYYAGTNIPAEGIQFYIDGELVTANGEEKKTDADGYYQISVPIGEHYVQAKLGGHTMAAGGRFPTKKTFNFNRAVQHDFADSTLVNFVGRVGGGVRNDTLAVGFAESKNNIGMAIIQLKLNNESFSFNQLQGDPYTAATTQRTWDSDTTSIASRAWTGTDYDAKYIYIRTDSLTGEFSALLPPLKYITKSIRLVEKEKNPDIEFTTLPEIDMTNAMKELKDSLKQATELGDSVFHYYTYNSKMVQTHFSKPIVELSQPGSDPGVFGIAEYKGEDALGKFTVGNLWTKQDDGTIKYNYGFPIYNMGNTYRMTLYGYERYLNYDSGKPVEHIIPLNGQVLTIANEMSADQKVVYASDGTKPEYQPGQVYDLKDNQIVLDSVGRFTMQWSTGAPNVASPFTRHLGVTLVRNGRTYIPATLDAVVVGSLPMGNNFVTNGPSKVLMVLRDPPGAKSKTVWKRGTTTTTVETSANGGYGDEKFAYSTSTGVKTETHAGLGIMTLTLQNETTFDTNDGIHYKWNKESSNETSWAMTATQDISTSATKDYCGSRGDVFIGFSTNLLIGQCRKVGFFRDNESAPFELKENVAVSIGDSVTTNFMYSTYELEEVMMPKWKETRNNYLTQHFNTEDEAKAFVNNTNEVVYVTWLKEDDKDYGKKGTYLPVVPVSWDQKEEYVADDMVQWCNDQIDSWREVLSNNEEDKVKSMADHDNWRRNISFDGGSSYTYTSKNDTTETSKVSYSHNLGYMLKLGYSSKTSAFVTFKSTFSMDTENGWSHSDSDTDKEYNYAEFDYIFDDGNKGTDFSVDIYKSKAGWSDIFSLFGGQSYNPYEGEEKTKYFEEGQHTLSNGTVRMEQPDIKVSLDGLIGAKEATLTDVPSGQTGQFTLHLSNNSTTTQGFDFSYNIMVQEMADTLGLEILMDGVPANGRSIFVPAGETVKKIITVRQTDQSILDYEGVEIWFLSQYQPIKINDKCKLNVHFKPSSSPVDLEITDPVLNIETLSRNEGNLEMKVKNFDRQFKGMTNIGVEYRFEGATQWTRPSELSFLVNPKTPKEGDQVLPKEGDLLLSYNMSDDNLYPQGTYTFRAYTTTMYDKVPVEVYSSEVRVVKDNMRPRNLTTPAPTNGILRYGDDLVVEFDEDIVPGYVSDKNIIVTSKLNAQTVNHDVALQVLAPLIEEARTVNPFFINGDFSLEFWVLNASGGTILHQGSDVSNFSLGINDEGHGEVNIAGMKFTSVKKVPLNKWTFIALSYNATKMTFDLLAQYDTETVELFKDEPISLHEAQAIDYSSDNHLYLGGYWGFIHDLAIYNIYRDVYQAAAEKYQGKDGYVYGLVNYWPMNEGHGTVAHDLRHTHDFVVADAWQIESDNHCLIIGDEDGAKADITRIGTSRGESYAIEFWYESLSQPGEALFETGTPTIEGDLLSPSAKLRLRYDDEKNLVLDYGTKSQVVVDKANVPKDQTWRHMALNVVRGQAASFYLNGKRTAVIAETDVPMIEGTTMTFGKGGKSVSIDEVRIWNATLSESRLLNNMYNTLDTADVYSRGLVAYYPFEKRGTVDGGTDGWMTTLEDMAPGSKAGSINAGTKHFLSIMAPPLKNAPVESRVIAKPIASERKIVIRLEEGSGIKARDLEGTTLNITVDKILDTHGNQSAPIRWNTYVQLNTLKWMKDSVNIIKKYGDDYSFDVNIENRGGSTEYYTLYNMPQWLTLVDSERTDDIDPQKTKTLRFMVNPLVPVGNYDVLIGLQGNNEILEPLRIVMKVRGEKPAWSVDPNAYENSMSIVGQIYINGVLMGNNESLLAAFIGDECRGVVSPKQMRGAAYVAMSVYGTALQTINGQPADLDKGRPVSFRIWDATTGMTYTDVQITLPTSSTAGDLQSPPVTTITFDPSESYGNFDHPLIFTKSNLVEQPLNIRTGWNWMSLGVEPNDTKTSVVFKDLVTWNAQLKDKATGVAYCRGNYWMGSLKEVHANTMYKLQLTRMQASNDLPQPLIINGEQVKLADTPVTLYKGWNWIAYTPMTTIPIDEALAGANPQTGDQMKSQTGFAYYGPYGWEGNLEALESGKGYLYFSTDTTEKSFVYPNIVSSARSQIASRAQSALGSSGKSAIRESSFSPVEPTEYPDNMAVVIMLTDDGQAVTDAEVAAFIDGECRGAAFADEDLYYLLVAGEGSGQPMEIRVNVDGVISTVCTSLAYVSDGSIGTPWEPFVIDINDPSGIKTVEDLTMNNLRFDADVWYTLQGVRCGTTRPTRSGVYLFNGKKVVIRPNKKAS